MALGDGIRRNISTVPPAEQTLLIAAIKQLNQQPRLFPGNRTDFPAGGVSHWFKQDEIHQATHVHGGPHFLPWHRELCNRFEAMLREVDARLSLHYWDWNTDPHPLFTPTFMGSPTGDAGEPWLSAKFYNPNPTGDQYRDDAVHSLNKPSSTPSTWRYALHANPADPPRVLQRNVQPGVPPVGTTNFGGEHWSTDTELVSAATYAGFDDLMQGSAGDAHGLAHGWIGGDLADPHMSFRDPFVFLLHSNVDRLWAMWQKQPGHPERLDPNQVYGTFGTDSRINAPLQPWAGTGDWPTRPWYAPENQQVVKTCKHPSVVAPPQYDT